MKPPSVRGSRIRGFRARSLEPSRRVLCLGPLRPVTGSTSRSVLVPGSFTSVADRLPRHQGDVEDDVEARTVLYRTNLTFDGTHAVVQPGVPVIVGDVLDRAEELSHPRRGHRGEPFPMEQDRRGVVSLEDAAEGRLEGPVGATARVVRGA